MPTGTLDLRPSALTPHQREVFRAAFSGAYRWIVWVGAVRSGKSVGAVYTLVHLALESRRPCAVAGPTIEAVKRNLGPYFREVAAYLGVSCREGLAYTIDGVPIYIYGSSKADSHERLRGATFRAGLIDEAAQADPEFVQTMMDRCSGDDGLVILSTNASGPENHLKLRFIDGDVPKSLLVQTRIEDNRHLGEDRRADYYAAGGPHHLAQRNLENIWAAPSALVVPLGEYCWAEPPDPAIVRRRVVGLDPGAGGVTAAIRLAQADHEHGGTMYAVEEYYHDSQTQGRLSDREHLARIVERWPMGGSDLLVIDSAASNCVIEARRMKLPARLSRKSRARNFVHTANCLAQGLLRVNPALRHLRREAAAMEWNPITDEPVSNADDHLLDALAYAVRRARPPRRL